MEQNQVDIVGIAPLIQMNLVVEQTQAFLLHRQGDGIAEFNLIDCLVDIPYIYGSSLSSYSEGSRSRVSSDQYPSHHYSVSDGSLSYQGSPSESFLAPRWTSPVQKFTLERHSFLKRHALPLEHLQYPIVSGLLHLYLSEPWESSNKQHFPFTHHYVSNRRSYMSKPISPLASQNPVSDGDEVCGSRNKTNCMRLSPSDDMTSMWCEGSSSVDLKFHSALTELQKMEASPDSSTNSRREGFQLSNGSSYDMRFVRESIDTTDQIDLVNVKLPYDHSDIHN